MVNQKKETPLKALHDKVSEQLDAGVSGEVMMRDMCLRVDELLVQLWQEKAPNASKLVDLVAVGGYGRGELAPQSDWDIWFLVADDMDETCGQELETFLYALWDLGVKIGYAVRSVKETLAHVKEDWNSATAALEARLIYGENQHFEVMQDKLGDFFRSKRKPFVEAKLTELETRHKHTGDTAFLMEPDIKESKGGLRDVQSVFWMAKAWYGTDCCDDLVSLNALSALEFGHLCTAQDFLWRCRAALHLMMKRPTDRLGFEQQAMLADRMGYVADGHHPSVELFMKDYFRHAGRISRVAGLLTMHFQELLHPQYFSFERNIDDGFTLEGQRVGIQHEGVFQQDSLRLLRIFHVSQLGHRRLSSAALRQIRADVTLIDDDFRANQEAHAAFLQILRDRRNVASALEMMNATGVLGRFIPRFRDVVGLGQFNRYHAYTVDEHTLRAVGEARNFFHGRHGTRLSLAHQIWHQISRPELLYLALIFHDIAKGMPGDHSENGELIAHDFCQKIGLNKDATELVSWLVRKHLSMAITSQRFDISDADVIAKFAEKVVDIERLNYLFLLTVADIAAVGPNVWNDWKGGLLSELYHATASSLMRGGEKQEALQERLSERMRTRIESCMARADASEKADLKEVLKNLPWRCVMHFPPRQLYPLAQMLVDLGTNDGVALYVDKAGCETVVMVVAKEQPCLFAALTTAMAVGHINILAAQAFDLKDDRILDVFHVQSMESEALSVGSDLSRLKQRLEHVLQEGCKKHAIPIISKTKINVLMRKVPVRVRELPLASSQQTAIEVAASEQPALLARLAWIIDESGFSLRGAAITSFGERVVDVFFIEGKHASCLTTQEVASLCSKLKEEACLPEEV
ncbi:MAG: [protein-PII] uridylyltransferase [Mariprofundaceae bacterium]|nr:[protein-PII] uridylyltransferase [Mariprofundaceae bacterium]